MQHERLKLVDSIRGLAACAVVLFHLNEVGVFAPSTYQWVVKHGFLGVPAFFVVSGFAVRQSLWSVDGTWAFLVRRFCRIYPAFAASLLLVLFVVVMRKIATGSNDLAAVPRTFGGWMATLLLATVPVTSVPAMNWVYWSLSFEVAFYLLMALTLLRRSLEWPILVVTLATAVIVPDLPVFFLSWLSFFVVGVALADLVDGKSSAGPLVALGLCAADFVCHRALAPVLIATIVAIAIYASSVPQGRWLNKDALFSKLGDLSYSLYLVHVPIGVWVFLNMVDAFPRVASAQSLPLHVAIDVGALLVCIAVSWAFYRAVELPSHQFGRRMAVRMSLGKGKDPERRIRRHNEFASSRE